MRLVCGRVCKRVVRIVTVPSVVRDHCWIFWDEAVKVSETDTGSRHSAASYRESTAASFDSIRRVAPKPLPVRPLRGRTTLRPVPNAQGRRATSPASHDLPPSLLFLAVPGHRLPVLLMNDQSRLFLGPHVRLGRVALWTVSNPLNLSYLLCAAARR